MATNKLISLKWSAVGFMYCRALCTCQLIEDGEGNLLIRCGRGHQHAAEAQRQVFESLDGSIKDGLQGQRRDVTEILAVALLAGPGEEPKQPADGFEPKFQANLRASLRRCPVQLDQCVRTDQVIQLLLALQQRLQPGVKLLLLFIVLAHTARQAQDVIDDYR